MIRIFVFKSNQTRKFKAHRSLHFLPFAEGEEKRLVGHDQEMDTISILLVVWWDKGRYTYGRYTYDVW